MLSVVINAQHVYRHLTLNAAATIISILICLPYENQFKRQGCSFELIMLL